MAAKQAVLDRTVADDKPLSQTVCQKFSEDNQVEGFDFTATKVHWLSKTDYEKKVGSLLIWLNSKFAALENTFANADQTAPPTNAEELERDTESTVTTITQVLEELVPRARDSPHNERWWTRELTGPRDEYTTRRNRFTTLRSRG